ncbi:MAG TPA: ABC transporter ATP-binding protein [Acidimicrobiales bacterium]|nr:ABC transporter ATP-binding protein [Acidimicrobiales bacterium]
MGAVAVSDLVVRYGDVVAVDGVSFSADAGEVVAVLGPNGAGKTSTIETLEGYRRPTSGSVRVLGLDPVRDGAALKPRIGVMLQRGGVYPGMHAVDAARLFASYYDAPADPMETLARVGLEGRVAKTPWRALSGGEQQRVSLALALLPKPEVAFLDEPTAGIDPGGRRVIRDVVRSLRDDGVCVLLTTHDLEEAEKTADRIVIIDRGRVVAEGTPSTLMQGTGTDIRFGASPGLDVAALATRLEAPVVEERPGDYRVEAEPTPTTVAALTAWLAERGEPLADLRAGRQSLEDVFLRLTQDADPS